MSDQRAIRLFLSSTFRDFGEERDLLVRKVNRPGNYGGTKL
jgi:hypothetical protein